jgi:hypothetical protein
MGMWGYLHRVPADRLSALLADPTQIQRAVLYGDGGELPQGTVEKAWNAIEFILDRLAQAERIPWVGPLTEGAKTGISFDHGSCWYRTPAEVEQVATVLSGLKKEEFRAGYMPDVMAKYNVYPDIWDRSEEAEENFEYLWGWFSAMVKFYQEAAAKGEGMLLYIG